ncbi:NAD(P)-dependent oxidoreductase [Halobacteriales archaeon QS_5_70_17]|nr:MAG: NAD(P)-dependent oxidoreductase [Halobacteriales archaeon QS_5_70_17]
MADLDGRTALVTGASQGIGRRIARTLADCGARVALAARAEENLRETAGPIPDDRALVVGCDVTEEDSVAGAVEATVEEFGGLDILVNNAGVAGPTAPVEEVTVEAFDRTMAVNARGVLLATKHAAPHLRASDAGRVVNIASISGKRPLPDRTPYAASKMAVIGLTRTLAFELGEDDVTVNAVCPGATEGPRIESVIDRQAERRGVDYERAKREVFTDDTALGTLVEATDTADLVAYLAGDAGRHVTAQDINVDAGSTWY